MKPEKFILERKHLLILPQEPGMAGVVCDGDGDGEEWKDSFVVLNLMIQV